MKQNPLSARRVFSIFLLCSISSSIIAQKVDLDTLDIDQLNLYRHKAVSMRNAGTILCFSSIGIIATGGIITVIKKQNIRDPYDNWEDFVDAIPTILGIIACIPVAVTGISLRTIGDRRIAEAELAIQRIIVAPENSMAVGLGLTIRF